MDILKNKFIFAPFILFALLFALDKIFLLPVVREQTQVWNKIEPAIYKSRRSLFQQLKNKYPSMVNRREKLGLILGTSRAGEFNSKHFTKFIPNSHTYNFSAPLAGPSFLYYWFSKILEAGIKPNFVILEADPVLFSPFSMHYPLAYAFDLRFMLKHVDINRKKPKNPTNIYKIWNSTGGGFSFDEAGTFFLKNSFALYKYPPDFRAFKKNRKVINPITGQNGHDVRKFFSKLIADANQNNLGGIPNVMLKVTSPDKIARLAKEDARIHLHNYRPNFSQIIFFKKILHTLAKNKINTIIYWPLASKPYRSIMESLGLVKKLQDLIQHDIDALKVTYPKMKLSFVDPDIEGAVKCRYFRDSHHLSGKCYEELTKYLLKKSKIVRKNNSSK